MICGSLAGVKLHQNGCVFLIETEYSIAFDRAPMRNSNSSWMNADQLIHADNVPGWTTDRLATGALSLRSYYRNLNHSIVRAKTVFAHFIVT